MKKITKGGLRRRFAIGAAGARGGLGLLSSKVSAALLPKDQQQAHHDESLRREATRFVKRLGELKGAYVKIGQMLALYGEHLLPNAVTEALHTLEAQTEPLVWVAIEPHIKAGLGEKFELIEIERTSFAAASLSQVHMANAKGIKKSLCVKVQYPEIANAIEDDFRNVLQMLTLARWVKSGRQLDHLTRELKTQLLREVDYRCELETATLVKNKLENDQRYYVPKYYPKFCTQSLLTMEFIDGVDVTSPKVQALSQARRNALAMAMLELFFKEAFEWGVMQTDPNFGNYRILIDEEGQNDKIGLLDFGAVHSLADEFTACLLYTSPSPRDKRQSRMPSSA